MDKYEFEKLVEETLTKLPLQFREKLENVEVVVNESVPQDLKESGAVLLGLYRGIPLKKRGIWYHAALPDKITIYKNTIERICRNENEIKRKIKEVLYHEIGHHFGLNEEELK